MFLFTTYIFNKFGAMFDGVQYSCTTMQLVARHTNLDGMSIQSLFVHLMYMLNN